MRMMNDDDDDDDDDACSAGNLSRNSVVRRSLMRNRTDEALGLLLGHSQPDVLLAITGVFVNISADVDCKSLLLKPTANTLQIYAELLRRVSFKDIHLATLICQVWTNRSCGSSSSILAHSV